VKINELRELGVERCASHFLTNFVEIAGDLEERVGERRFRHALPLPVLLPALRGEGHPTISKEFVKM
jgi:hypothetical protein